MASRHGGSSCRGIAILTEKAELAGPASDVQGDFIRTIQSMNPDRVRAFFMSILVDGFLHNARNHEWIGSYGLL